MVRQLWLLRHADAEPHGTREDAQRRLTARGEHQARVAGRAIARVGASFDAILVSPKVRAQQTAGLAAGELGAEQRELLRTHSPLAGGFGGEQALDALSGLARCDRVLLVGHEPDMSRVVCDLTSARVDVKKGGLVMMRLESSTRAELAIVMRPHELELIAGDN